MAGILKGIKTLLGDVEIAPYDVVADRGEYEERQYPAKKWVCSSRSSIDRQACSSTLFRALFNYVAGKNKPNIRLDMTSPVITYIEPCIGDTSESTFTMAFYIPEEYQNNPPDPADSTIFVADKPELRVLTRRFGGFANDDVVAKEAKELAEIIKKSGENGVNFDHYYIATYDPPYKPISRRNEIWFMKQVLESPNIPTEGGDKVEEKSEPFSSQDEVEGTGKVE